MSSQSYLKCFKNNSKQVPLPSLPTGWLPLSPSYIEILEPTLFIFLEPHLKQEFGGEALTLLQQNRYAAECKICRLQKYFEL